MFLTRNVHATPPPLRPLTRLTTRRFPPKLRSMCHCLYQVVTQRFQQSTVEAVWTVIGTVVFLRFINPALGIPQRVRVCVRVVCTHVHVCTCAFVPSTVCDVTVRVCVVVACDLNV